MKVKYSVLKENLSNQSIERGGVSFGLFGQQTKQIYMQQNEL